MLNPAASISYSFLGDIPDSGRDRAGQWAQRFCSLDSLVEGELYIISIPNSLSIVFLQSETRMMFAVLANAAVVSTSSIVDING